MDIHIDEIQRISSPGDSPGYLRVYVRVTATEGAKNITEEFHIGRQVVGRRVVTNAQGRLKTISGQFVDPEAIQDTDTYTWQYEPAFQDLRAELLDVVRATMRRRLDTGWQGDKLRMRDRLNVGDKLTLPLAVRQLEGQVDKWPL